MKSSYKKNQNKPYIVTHWHATLNVYTIFILWLKTKIRCISVLVYKKLHAVKLQLKLKFIKEKVFKSWNLETYLLLFLREMIEKKWKMRGHKVDSQANKTLCSANVESGLQITITPTHELTKKS